ncbi:MAG: bifunctional nuclease family protein [Chloroflexi bacterium]|nr:bifunctional nuclease family protein [Chloroflexota bacterium]MBK7176722.1 bifunctional nuclease family protein [Chloroflexota bacterium]MBK7915699.1 bifunctional nuclease family protein [Chloroflexota bacterium]MBP6804428.1 bifunctional nuclease family protein [Chloroflexota bacterium]MBP7590551.1 bifunctional nuclease family protein [Chloroflexota bacterium]
MIEVVIESIRISLVSQHRIVLLKELDNDRQLPIWIGPCEADAITIELQDVKVARPVTHDLLKSVITEMGGRVSHVLIRALQDGVFHASLFIDKDGDLTEVDCRSSDAIALAVRVKVPIFINDDVMEQAGVLPEVDIQQPEPPAQAAAAEAEETLDIFSDFVDTLDFDDFDE